MRERTLSVKQKHRFYVSTVQKYKWEKIIEGTAFEELHFAVLSSGLTTIMNGNKWPEVQHFLTRSYSQD